MENNTNKLNKLTIATSSNMQFAIREIVRDFKDLSGVDCEIVVSSSGKLASQIMEGAPFDVFVAADLRYPMEVFRNDFTLDTPRIYATGSLVLWTFVEGIEPDLGSLNSEQIKHIAIANPKTAPYGEASAEALKNAGIYESVVHKFVFGESLAQSNQFVRSGAAEIGLTSLSTVNSLSPGDQAFWTAVPTDLYSPIRQGAAVIKQKDEKSTQFALEFLEFLFSDRSRKILNKFGYLTPTDSKQ